MNTAIMQRETFILKLVSYRMVTPKVRHMEFATINKVLDYIPGQFITIHFELEGVLYNRSYSIGSIPTQTQNIEIAVSPFTGGPGTEYLFSLHPGDEVQTTGPFGRLILRDEQPKRYILIATGTGVTPYRSMLPELHQRLEKQNTKVVILLGVQSPNDLLYGEDFRKFAAKHPDFEFHAFYSRLQPDNPLPSEHKGYVQSYFNSLQLEPEQDLVYLCGNPNMIDEAFQFLLTKNFTTHQIRREKYISPKR